MSFLKITRPTPAQKKKRRPLRRRDVIYCDCGLPAVAQLSVKVGLNGCYRVVLHLCAECLSLEEEEH